MKTKEQIKNKALEMFNQSGLSNTTLRHVAEALNKSYGNITYHYKTKEQLVTELYLDMIKELSKLPSKINPNQEFILFELTKYSYDISAKYLFFLLDYIELKRNYTSLMTQADKDNHLRMESYRILLMSLQKVGILRPDMDSQSLTYLMELSGAIRTFYFQKHHGEKTKRSHYVEYVNQYLFPYLSTSGVDLMKKWEKANL